MARTKLQFGLFTSLLVLLLFGRAAFADSCELVAVLDDKPTASEIKKLIDQLGSSKFAERETASKRLQEIGEPALDDLRKAAADGKDAELRRRAKDVIQKISPETSEAPWEALLKQGIREATTHQNYKKAVEILTKAGKLAEESLRPNPTIPNQPGIPILAEIYLHLARSHRAIENWQQAGNAYNRATRDSNSEKRKEIHREWSEMTDKLVAGWEKTVKTAIDKDGELKKTADKYPFVVLHYRRFDRGGDLKP